MKKMMTKFSAGIERQKYVAVESATARMGGADWLKRQLLIYDEVALLWLGAAKAELRAYSEVKARRADDYEFLEDNGVIWEATPPADEELADNTVATSVSAALSSYSALHTAKGDDSLAHTWDYQSHLVRATACAMRLRGSPHVFPLLGAKAWAPTDSMVRRDQVFQIVIKNFPMVDEEISFQDLFSLRSEDEFLQRRDGFRLWVRKAASGSASLAEIKEDLVYQLNEYISYMKAVKLKYSLTSVGAVSKFTAGFGADLLSLKWKDAIDSLFSIAAIPAAISEAERKAPGRELSFLTYIGNVAD